MVALSTLLARAQLSEDIGDVFAGTTTATGTTTTFKDTKLANYDDDNFVNKFETWVLLVDGNNAGEIRRVTSKAGTTGTVAIAFSNAVASGVKYEIHRVAHPDEKDSAITHALNLLNGVIIFKRAQAEFTTVANQFDYDVPSGFYRDQLRQIHIVSTGDTEITREIFDWEPRVDSGGGKDIHFFSRLAADQTVRVFGHQVVSLTDLTDGSGDALILSARAAMHLFNTLISQGRNEEIARWQTLWGQASAQYQERLARFREMGIPFTLRTEAYRGSAIDRDFGI